MFARQQAAALMDMKDRAKAHDATIVAIGSGTPEQAKAFAENFHFDIELYVDPQLKSYKAFGLERGFCRTLGPSSIARGFKAMMNGFHQGLHAGDLWQQGGVFVLGPGKQVVFSHRDDFAGDHAEAEAVLDACSVR